MIGLVGCFSPSAPANVPCGDGDACPSGQRCIEGFCGGPLGNPNNDASPDPDTLLDPGDAPADSQPVPPQMTFGESGGDAISGTWVDTFLNAGTPENNWGTHVDLHLTANVTEPILIRVDVSAVPSNATITGARLRFRVSAETIPIGTEIDVFEMNEAWTEGNDDNSPGVANLISRSNNNVWSGTGATPPSRSVEPIASTTVDALLDFGDELVITLPPELIAGWVTDEGSNNGIAVIVDATDFYCEFRSSEAGNASVRPRLELDLE